MKTECTKRFVSKKYYFMRKKKITTFKIININLVENVINLVLSLVKFRY